jgi:hypothetical protein
MADNLSPGFPAPGPSAWFAVVAGVIVALAVHILLTLLGIGFGAMAFTSRAAPGVLNWGAFFWWALAGMVAAFAGGYIAAGFAGLRNARQAQMLAFLSWALALVVVSALVAFTAINTPSVFRHVAGPAAALFAQLDLGGVNPRAAESLRQSVSIAALASFVALLVGAFAAMLGGRMAAGGGIAFQMPRFTITRVNNLNR